MDDEGECIYYANEFVNKLITISDYRESVKRSPVVKIELLAFSECEFHSLNCTLL